MTTSCAKDDRPRLFIDLETYSSVDISKAGAFKYVRSPDFEIILLSAAWDTKPVHAYDMCASSCAGLAAVDPAAARDMDQLAKWLLRPDIVKVAQNAAFERAALSVVLGEYLPPEQWEEDTMIMAAMHGLPMSLDAMGAALQFKDQKLKEGAALINYFCKPCKPTKANGGRTRNLPEHAPDKWERFRDYNVRDVEVHRAAYYRLKDFPVPAWERRVWALDARINERGVLIDMSLAESAIAVADEVAEANENEMRQITGLDNPNSVAQLKDWLEECGVVCESLNKETVAELAITAKDPAIKRALQLRQLMSKTSVKKYQAMLAAACEDNRVRGLLQYYGASRTGRWAGRLLQVQNLPQNHLDNIAEVRELVRARDVETLELLYESVPAVLSQLIRTALIAPEGHTFLVADYSAIEARVVAYLAGEKWQQEAFAAGKDLYCETASQMFGVPVEKHGVNSHLRQKGKIATLACGYGGGVGALKAFGADKMGLTEEEMQAIVTQWRLASPTIPKFWRDAENAARRALENPGKSYALPCGVKYMRDADALRCKLPSGRILSYWGARLEEDGDMQGHIVYQAQNQTTRKWEKVETWGGKLVENIVQAYARDCLAVALLRLDEAGFKIVFHVHDEIIAEEPKGGRTWEDMAEIMGRPIDWAPGLLLRGDGYATDFYMKD